MRFEQAYAGWNAERLTQDEAARLLGMCARSFRWYVVRFEADRLEGLIDRRLEQVSNRRAPVDEVMALAEQYRGRHAGWNVKHFHSWYKREGCTRSYTWVKKRLSVPSMAEGNPCGTATGGATTGGHQRPAAKWTRTIQPSSDGP